MAEAGRPGADPPGAIPSLFVSPHFDDVALSCGGTVILTARRERALVLTVFAGEPTGELSAFARFQHARWGAGERAVDLRRQEDARAMAALGVDYQHLDFRDAIYRGALYRSDDDLFGPVKAEDTVAATVGDTLLARGAALRPRNVYLPLGVGGHVDHRLCRSAARALRSLGIAVFLYEDLPYAAQPGAVERWVPETDLDLAPQLVDITDVMDQKLQAVAAYASQLTTIFRHHGPFESVLRSYAASLSPRPGGYAERLWRVIG